MRELFLENFILDTSGFIIDRKGNILPTHVDKEGEVYCTVEGTDYYFTDLIEGYKEPNYKNIKLMKKSGLWKTFVVSTGKSIDNLSFKGKHIAALWVNQLYITYNLDRIPNTVPINHREFKE